jgi:hypothetical protein
MIGVRTRIRHDAKESRVQMIDPGPAGLCRLGERVHPERANIQDPPSPAAPDAAAIRQMQTVEWIRQSVGLGR